MNGRYGIRRFVKSGKFMLIIHSGHLKALETNSIVLVFISGKFNSWVHELM